MLVAVLMLASCEKKAEESAWQQKLRQVAELGTVQYTVQKVVSNSDETWQIFGDRKILFSFRAVIKAGIDMDKFDADLVVSMGGDGGECIAELCEYYRKQIQFM